jgi:hypothetical protein
MNMSYRLLASGAFVCALTLLSYAGAAEAGRLVPNGASSLIILAADEEQKEIQNELDPESDDGQPGGAMKSEGAPKAEEKAAPAGGDSANKIIEKELQEENE